MCGARCALAVTAPTMSSLVKTGGWCCSAALCSRSASQGKQRRGQRMWRRLGGGVCLTGRSSVVMGLRPGWSHGRGEVGRDGCIVELKGRRAPGPTTGLALWWSCSCPRLVRRWPKEEETVTTTLLCQRRKKEIGTAADKWIHKNLLCQIF
jgi:hypothetical protein